MPLPFILGGLALVAAGYGVKKSFDASDTADEINIVIKKANDLKEEAIKKAELVESDCKNALMRFGEKKFHVQSYSMSSFVKEFNQLKGCEFVVKVADMQDLCEQVSNAQNSFSQLNTKAASKKADVVIDNLQAVRKMADLFTRQITKCDALFFSLSQDAIATMKKHNYDTSRYNQKEKDQLCVAVSTLMTLSAFLKMPIIDKDQKLQEKVQRALEIMIGQMDALESGHYDVEMIQSRQKDFENLLKGIAWGFER